MKCEISAAIHMTGLDLAPQGTLIPVVGFQGLGGDRSLEGHAHPSPPAAASAGSQFANIPRIDG
jgi:hypothetical protein